MEKFIITKVSGNPITGKIMVTTSPRKTCPTACPFRKDSGNGACYAEHGMLGGFIWTKLDRLPAGETFGHIAVRSKADLIDSITSLPPGTIWRHNQAGDLATDDQLNIDEASLTEIVVANKGRKGFTYTHFDVENNLHNRRVVKEANESGFTVNLSGNNLEHADELADLGIAPVTVVVPMDQMTNTVTPMGRKVIICPARTEQKLTCKECRICSKQRQAIVAFPALGARKHIVQ